MFGEPAILVTESSGTVATVESLVDTGLIWAIRIHQNLRSQSAGNSVE